MDTRTGKIVFPEEFAEMLKKASTRMEDIKKDYIEMMIPPTQKQLDRKPFPRVGRNEPCPCGSGKKFKFCCYQKAKEIK